MNKKAVIFDMDGVIFDTEKLWKASFYCTAKAFGITPTEKFRIGMIGTNKTTYIQKIEAAYPGVNGTAFYNHLAEFVENSLAPLMAKKFVQYVQKLKEKGFCIALATGSRRHFAEKLFASIGIDINTFFDATICGDEITLGKPDPQSYLLASEKLKVNPQNAFVLEDSPNGILAAHAAGCRTLMVVDCVKPTKQLKANTEKVFKTMKGAIKYILKQDI